MYLETEKILFDKFDKFKDDYPNKEYVGVYIGPDVDKTTCFKCYDSFRCRYPSVKVKKSSVERQ